MCLLSKILVFLLTIGVAELKQVDLEPRIYYGQTADPNQFPYQVYLSFKEINSSIFYGCGGAILSPNWIITAAHCTKGREYVLAYLGSIKRKEGTPQRINSSDFVPFSQNLRDDIALLRANNIQFSASVQRIKLPRIQNQYETYEDQTVTLAGWGKNENGYISDKLKFVHMYVMSNLVCEDEEPVEIRDSHICASSIYTEQTACLGDSGGPLVLAYPSDGTELIGVVSGCFPGYPIVFTRITHYLEWIKNVTGISY